jgi:hypothetical protein
MADASPNGLSALRTALDSAVVSITDAEIPDAIGALASASARLTARLVARDQDADSASCPNLVTAEVVAERFHLALSSVHELARQGKIPCRMFGRWRRFDLAEVAAAGLDSKSVPLASLAPEKGRKKAA